jgi:superfamily II DNA or RNA helicase
MMAPKTTRQWLANSLGAFESRFDLVPPEAGEANLELAPFQEAAVCRAVEIIRRLSGVILADAVGLGKTRMALAIARIVHRDELRRRASAQTILVCVPARLRSAWQQAAVEAGWQVPGQLKIVSHTELSQRNFTATPDKLALLVVDEAHAFRNPEARRSANLARLSASTPTLLVTATPVCNGLDDLYHLLRLFLSEHDLRDELGLDLGEAFRRAEEGDYDLTELVEQVVIRRRDAGDVAGFGRRPTVRLELAGYDPTERESWIWTHLPGELDKLNLALLRQDWPRGLFNEYVLRRWESGPEALEESLRRLVDYHQRWLEAHETGRTLDRRGFEALFGRDDVRNQGVFPFVYGEMNQATVQTVLPSVVEADLKRLEGLLDTVGALVAQGHGAAAAMAELIAAHRGEKFLIFSTYQRAAQGLFEALQVRLGPNYPLGLITGSGARSTGMGRAKPEEILKGFAPVAQKNRRPSPQRAIDVLICTDCLSEGVNLQDCSRIILADLPYSPVKVEQRIGRLVRPGSARHEVVVYWLRPRKWQDSLGMRLRLDHKIQQAGAAGVDPMNAKLLRADVSSATFEEPLAALTAQDRLAREVRAPGWEPDRGDEPRFFSAKAGFERPILYVRAFFGDGQRVVPLWCVVEQEGPLRHRLGDVLPELVRLSDLDLDVLPCPEPTSLLERAKTHLESRRCLLDAARLAPLSLPASRPQQRLWRRLCDELSPMGYGKRLDELRDRLLRPYPRGLEQRLERLLDQAGSPERLLHQLEELPGLRAPSGSVQCWILWGLLVT